MVKGLENREFSTSGEVIMRTPDAARQAIVELIYKEALLHYEWMTTKPGYSPKLWRDFYNWLE